MAPKTDTRELLLNTAQELVQLQSYDGFSFRDLAEIVGIRKASIYHHFASKEALATAMLERSREGLGRWAALKTDLPPFKRLEAYCFDLYLGLLGGGTKLCPAGAFASSWGHMPEDVRRAAQAVFREQQHFLEAAIAAGIEDGSIAAGRQSAADLAEWMIANVQGALVIARATASENETGEAIFTRLCQQTLQRLAS